MHVRALRRARLRAAREARHRLLADDLQPAVLPERPRRQDPHLPARHGRAREHQGRLPQGAGRLRRARDPLRLARSSRSDEPQLVPKQLFEGLRDALPGLTPAEVARGGRRRATARCGPSPTAPPRGRARCSSGARARTGRRSWCWPARITWIPGSATRSRSTSRPTATRSSGASTFPIDADLLDWAFGPDVAAGHIRSPLDIRDIWPSSYSSNTNEIIWGAKFAARVPWIACVVRLSSYECGMDQPTYTPVQQIVERSGTLFFSFQDLDATKPAGSMKIRVETIAHYLGGHAKSIIDEEEGGDAARLPAARRRPRSRVRSRPADRPASRAHERCRAGAPSRYPRQDGVSTGTRRADPSPSASRLTVGSPAPLFGLRSVQGATVELAAYRGQLNVVLWFSRGFTCPFCRDLHGRDRERVRGAPRERRRGHPGRAKPPRERPHLLPRRRRRRSPSSAIPTSASTRCTASATGARSRPHAPPW